jgi:PAS domain S-box-containing protein
MTGETWRAPHLAALLAQNKAEIVTTWAGLARDLPGGRYAQHDLAELRAWFLPALEAAIETCASGSFAATEAHLHRVALDRLGMGFGIAEVIEGLLLLGEAVRRAVPGPGPVDGAGPEAVRPALDAYLRAAAGCFGQLYTQAMDRELRASEERFRTVADFTYDWEYWRNPEGEYLYVSPSCERITGYRSEEFRDDARLIEAIVHAEDREAVAEHLREEPIEGSVVQPMAFRILTRAGEERWLEHVCQPVYGASGHYLGRRGSNRDISERKRAQAALEAQAREQAVATERSRLARELHDSVTQALYSVTLYAEATRLALASEKLDVATENLNELHKMAREAMLDMRMLIFELHPPQLEEEGLVAALKARLAAVESRAQLRTEIRVQGERPLPILVGEELFRIALEALNNVIKHANASQVTVDVAFPRAGVRLTVIDDGVGFDPASAQHSGGMGLQGMEERAQRIGGLLAVESAPGQGTAVRVTVQDTG